MTKATHKPACLDLVCELIRCQSITPNDANCQHILARRLQAIGFEVESYRFGEVANLWARLGSDSPLLVLAGHTDVVPPGDQSAWDFAPFSAQIDKGILYGRGAADMKSSLAAMVVALEQLFKAGDLSKLRGSIALLITSDEEGDAIDGTSKVVDHLIDRGIRADYAIIGEPSSNLVTGDTIRIGRRGSLTGKLQLQGRQGHVAYPETLINPIHTLAKIISKLSNERWDNASEDFPASSLQLVSCHSDAGASNVVPSIADACFNIRFSNQVTEDKLRTHIEKMIADTCAEDGSQWCIEWRCSAQPFLSASGKLHLEAIKVIDKVCGYKPELSTGGGTSDGRFLIHLASELIELGPSNATIHQVNECIALEELDILTCLYRKLIANLVT